MKTRNIVIIAIIVFLIFIGLIVGGIILARRFFTTPLNPTLALEVTPTPVAIAPSPTPEESDQGELACSGTGKMNLIQIGIVPPLEIAHAGADAIRLMVVDFDQPGVTILAIPTDLWVLTPGDLLGDLGPTSPLNLIYLEAYQEAIGDDQNRTQQATQVLAQTIVDEFGFVPDQYMTINGESFLDIVDTLGGVEITLATEIDASAENYGVFPAGEQTLDGLRTLDFVRILYPDGAGPDQFGRFQRQNMVINALFNALISPENWTKVPDMVSSVKSLAVTDLSLAQIEALACIIDEVGSDAEQLSVTEKMINIDTQGRMIPDTDAILELIDQLEGE